jgi:hypothetical protein
MKSVSRSVLVGFMFVMGCAAGGAAHSYVATARAADAAPGSRWAYHCFKEDDVQSIQETANAVGREGWEMASSSLAGGHDMSSPIWCFKRKW